MPDFWLNMAPMVEPLPSSLSRPAVKSWSMACSVPWVIWRACESCTATWNPRTCCCKQVRARRCGIWEIGGVYRVYHLAFSETWRGICCQRVLPQFFRIGNASWEQMMAIIGFTSDKRQCSWTPKTGDIRTQLLSPFGDRPEPLSVWISTSSVSHRFQRWLNFPGTGHTCCSLRWPSCSLRLWPSLPWNWCRGAGSEVWFRFQQNRKTHGKPMVNLHDACDAVPRRPNGVWVLQDTLPRRSCNHQPVATRWGCVVAKCC